jgi:hypothetical protein
MPVGRGQQQHGDEGGEARPQSPKRAAIRPPFLED